MSTPLLPLLDILSHPDNPGFAAAAERLGAALENFNPATLTESERMAVHAKLDHVIAILTTTQNLTAQDLGLTQKRAQALQSYSRLK